MRAILTASSGLLGAAGVAAAAASSHGAAMPTLSAASLICLTHAPVLLMLALHAGASRVLRAAGILILFGAALFAGDMAWRAFIGGGIFPMAAPIGGFVLIVGWLGISVAGMTRIGGRLP